MPRHAFKNQTKIARLSEGIASSSDMHYIVQVPFVRRARNLLPDSKHAAPTVISSSEREHKCLVTDKKADIV